MGGRPPPKIGVSIILPTWDRAHLLPAAIASLQHQSLTNFELIVVDDSSSDATWNYLSSLGGTAARLRLVRHRAHKGLADALNEGLRRARGALVFNFGDRMIAEPTCLERLVESFRQLELNHHRVGAVGPRFGNLYDPAPRAAVSPGDEVVTCGRFTGEIYHDFSRNGDGPIQVPMLHAYALLNRQLAIDLGGFSTKFDGSHWRIESDLYARMRASGYELYFEPRSVIHARHATSGGSRVKGLRNYYFVLRNHWIYLLRNFGFRSSYMIPAYSMVSALPRKAVQRLHFGPVG